MRIIGLDVGTKTVGVALSDPLGITAQPFETITRKENNKLRRTYARIEQIISEYDVTEIVVVYHMNSAIIHCYSINNAWCCCDKVEIIFTL